MARSSLLGWVFNYASLIPVVGETLMRLRMPPIVSAVFRGGVVDAHSIPPGLMKEMYLVGNRTGHYRAFMVLSIVSRTAFATRTTTGFVPSLMTKRTALSLLSGIAATAPFPENVLCSRPRKLDATQRLSITMLQHCEKILSALVLSPDRSAASLQR